MPNLNPPAFPNPPVYSTPDSYQQDEGSVGMELRDYFAGQALVGLLALQSNSQTARSVFDTLERAASGAVPGLMAGMAYEYADAMLHQREKRDADR